MKTKTLVLSAIAASLFASTASAGYVTTTVEKIRVFGDGRAEIVLADGDSNCGSKFRIPNTSQPALVRAAVAAKLSGNRVKVNHEDTPNGSLCNVLSVELL